jgi:hypothetical protein
MSGGPVRPLLSNLLSGDSHAAYHVGRVLHCMVDMLHRLPRPSLEWTWSSVVSSALLLGIDTLGALCIWLVLARSHRVGRMPGDLRHLQVYNRTSVTFAVEIHPDVNVTVACHVELCFPGVPLPGTRLMVLGSAYPFDHFRSLRMITHHHCLRMSPVPRCLLVMVVFALSVGGQAPKVSA